MKILKSTLITLLFLPMLLSAQKWDVGISAGITGYEGDVDKFALSSFKRQRIAGGLMLRRNFDSRVALRANLIYGSLSGNDADFSSPSWRVPRGFNFKAPLLEGSIQAEFQFVKERKRVDNISPENTTLSQNHNQENGNKLIRKRAIVPYGILGIGFGNIKPTTDYNNRTTPNTIASATLIAEDQAKTAASNKTHLVIPIGGGLRVNLTKRIALGGEIAFRPTFSDLIDGVSASGNSKRKDWYSTALLTLSRSFGTRDSDNDGIADDQDICPTIPGTKATNGCPDTDGDGIADANDACPDVAGSKLLRGCPDADKDGIADADDACPTAKGSAEMKGCPDTDGDGVADKDDKCPNEKGTKDHDGCPFADRDKDGIADANDMCPDLAGLQKYDGCPDTDGDGIADDKDNCPTKFGSKQYSGCPDTDADGISDEKDNCPTVAGVSANKGCPLETTPTVITTPTPNANTTSSVNTVITATGFIKKVYFTTSKALIAGQNLLTMTEVYDYLQANPGYDVKISGHTDNTGLNPSNRTLSEGRAKSCYDWLKTKGVRGSRMTFVGFASDKPDATNDNEAGRALNRRVEFEVFQH